MYHKTALSNHLRIVTKDIRERESVSIGILIGSGGRYEHDRNKGAAHFLEHILFKGSKKYSCDEIKQSIEGVGGSLNAFTSEEQTCYLAKIPAQYLNKTFDILSDMVFHPLIAKKDVDKERTVILEEIKMYHDLPQYYVLELLDELVWPNHPLGKNLAGTAESVGKMSEVDLREFHRQNYFPRNIVISACGRLHHDAFVKLVQNRFGSVRADHQVRSLPAVNSQDHAKVKFFRKTTEQMHLALGMLGLHADHEDKYPLILLHIILGGNMSSRLFNEVREKRGLAYSIASSAKFLKDTGIFMVRAGVDNSKIVAAVDVIVKELKKIRRYGVKKDEFVRARDYFLGQVLLELEDTMEHMLWMGESVMLRDKIVKIEDIVRKVMKIKPEDVQKIAGDVLREQHFNLAVVGPLKPKQEKELAALVGAA